MQFPLIRRSIAVFASAAVLGLGLSACASAPITQTSIPSWKATALGSAALGTVMTDSGKILNKDPIAKKASLTAGKYTLKIVCAGTGKAFFNISTGLGGEVGDVTASCNGVAIINPLKLSKNDTATISVSSVDAPLLYAYELTTAH